MKKAVLLGVIATLLISCGGKDGAGITVDIAADNAIPGDTKGDSPDQCAASCVERECGDDGCGGSCGLCPCDDCGENEVECITGMCRIPGWEASCPEILDCNKACHENSYTQICWDDCFDSGSPQGQGDLQSLVECLEDAGGHECGPEDQGCMDAAFSKCTDEYFYCFHGDKECLDVFACTLGCTHDFAPGLECVTSCWLSGTAEAMKLWQEVSECLQSSGYFMCEGARSACHEAAWGSCEEELRQCANGDLSCADIVECESNCAPADDVCDLLCLHSGTIDGQIQWWAVQDCIVDQCEAENPDLECMDAALQGACAAAHGICISI